ncbi:MAG TPA: hypothetical protein VGQ10_07170 [Vicinamibacterales bacterium]|jgi:hypothetical protein|nr:hypothetical protein [Vicinamibacterales bacterium]
MAVNAIPEGFHTVCAYLNVEDAAGAIAFYRRAFGARAADAGASVLSVVADQFYGDRSGRIADPAGHVWIVSTTRTTCRRRWNVAPQVKGQRSKVKGEAKGQR